jgi:hypothetical protein
MLSADVSGDVSGAEIVVFQQDMHLLMGTLEA